MPFSTDLQRRPSDHVVALEPPPGDRSAAGPGRLLCTLRLRAEDVDHVARLKPHLESRPDVVSARWLIGQNTPPPISTPPLDRGDPHPLAMVGLFASLIPHPDVEA